MLDLVDIELQKGTPPDRVGFVAFTKQASNEAKGRAMAKFGLSEDDLPFFSTLHSLAFRRLGLTREQVMDLGDYRELMKMMGLTIKQPYRADVLPDNRGDQIVFVDGLARLTGRSVQSIIAANAFVFSNTHVSAYRETMANFKRIRAKVDFTDMLEMFTELHAPTLDCLFVDEAQDLSPLQWSMIRKLATNVPRMYVAGDDDQAIYRWAGADVDAFLALGDRAQQVEVLPKSYRLPREIWAKAHTLLTRIKNRYPKQWEPAREGGTVRYAVMPQHVKNWESDSWLVLSRNRYQLDLTEDYLRSQGYPYIIDRKWSTAGATLEAVFLWERLRAGQGLGREEALLVQRKLRDEYKSPVKLREDQDTFMFDDIKPGTREDWMTAIRVPPREREYYRHIRRRGESLKEKPRIILSTIHQAKGSEADHVLLLSDYSRACYLGWIKDNDSETRVFYVGATRAKQSLTIMRPRTQYSFSV